MYQWIVFLHILGSIVFFVAHGASMVMAFQLRREQKSERIRALLDLSSAAIPAAYLGLVSLLIAGIVAGIMGNWFSRGWIWASLALMVVLFFGMHGYAAAYYTPIRKVVGLPYRDRQGEHPAEPAASDAEVAAVIQRSSPMLLCSVSFALIAVILWMMVFKPF